MLSGDTPTFPTATEVMFRGTCITIYCVMRLHIDSHTHGALIRSIPEDVHTLP